MLSTSLVIAAVLVFFGVLIGFAITKRSEVDVTIVVSKWFQFKINARD
jgi:hypothetical protein